VLARRCVTVLGGGGLIEGGTGNIAVTRIEKEDTTQDNVGEGGSLLLWGRVRWDTVLG